jgi:hypothetical protein
MGIPDGDREVLRELGREYMAIANLPVQDETRELWRRLNGLEPVRPLVWINEIPWHEMNVDDELTVRCEEGFCQGIETQLRRIIYSWKHMPGDMVVDPVWHMHIVCGPWGSYADYGIESNEHRVVQGTAGTTQFHSVIQSEADVDKLRTPEVWVDWEETERRFQAASEIFDGVMPVEKRGIVMQWMSAWDMMVHWTGIEQLYLDMLDKPDLIHRLLKRFHDAAHEVLDKQEELGLLDVSNGNHRVGSGGLGITDELPGPENRPERVTPKHQWGTAAAQIFSEVSPDMHEEFSLQYERPYMERFGLTCYGCCEPLHRKIGILRSVSNLRRISMSPFVDVEMAAEEVGADYVFSRKPNPAVLASETWNPDEARRELVDCLEKTRGCRLELIMKDIHTVREEPQRLWDWARIASEVAREYAP